MLDHGRVQDELFPESIASSRPRRTTPRPRSTRWARASSNSRVSSGCRIYGNVSDSILGRGVIVEPGATVRDSIVDAGLRHQDAALAWRTPSWTATTLSPAGTELRGTPDDVLVKEKRQRLARLRKRTDHVYSRKAQEAEGAVRVAPRPSRSAKTGGLGDVAGSLPRALKHAGAKAAVITAQVLHHPAASTRTSMKHVADFYVPLAWRNDLLRHREAHPAGVSTSTSSTTRPTSSATALYGYFDDGERFAFFCQGRAARPSRRVPELECDVLHCNDWQTALCPGVPARVLPRGAGL